MIDDHKIREIIKRYYLEAGSWRRVAPRFGVTPQYLHDLVMGKRSPGPKILKALNLKRYVIYK